MELLEKGRLSRSKALYHYSLGKKDDALVDIITAMNAYSSACDLVPAKHRKQAIDLMSESYNFAQDIKNKKSVLTHSQKLVYIGSKIGDSFYFPWMDDPCEGELDVPMDEPQTLNLSSQQQSMLVMWSRARELFTDIGWDQEVNVLYQDTLQDCSVIASLLSIIYLQKRSGNNLLHNRVHPGRVSSKYYVKLRINGADRYVIVDDYLPCSSGRSLYVTADANVLWPTMVEKAYMKLMGGYDFPGSHACLDTYHFTSWYPEYISLQVAEDDHKKTLRTLWDKMFSGWKNGDLMVCIGTGALVRDEAKRSRLIPDHDYTVIDMMERADERLILVKNPWRNDGKSVPPFAIDDLDVGYGSFWMDFDTIRMWFQTVYLNWNPKMFRYEQMQELTWDIDQIQYGQSTRSHWASPQHLVQNTSGQDAFVALLYTRHMNSKPYSGFLNLIIYDYQNRLAMPRKVPVVTETPSVNTSYISVRFHLPEGKTYLAVLCASEVSTDIAVVQYTLTTYSDQPIKVPKARDVYPHTKTISGLWDRQSSGGPWSAATYNLNPQYKIKVTQPASAKFYALSSTNLSINVQVFWSRGSPIRGYVLQNVLCSSGQYKIGCCMADCTRIDPGEYTAVVSTFQSGHGEFDLRVMTTDPGLEIEPLKPETAGLFCRSMSLEWNGKNRHDIPFHVERPCEMKLHFYTLPEREGSPAYRPSLRVSVYEGYSLVASSDEFDDVVFGIYLDHIKIKPNTTYIAAVERMEAGTGRFQLDAYSSSPIMYT